MAEGASIYSNPSENKSIWIFTSELPDVETALRDIVRGRMIRLKLCGARDRRKGDTRESITASSEPSRNVRRIYVISSSFSYAL